MCCQLLFLSLTQNPIFELLCLGSSPGCPVDTSNSTCPKWTLALPPTSLPHSRKCSSYLGINFYHPWFPSLSHTPCAEHWQILWALPSKHIKNLIISHHLLCYHLSPSFFHFWPALLWKPTAWSLPFLLTSVVYFQTAATVILSKHVS